MSESTTPGPAQKSILLPAAEVDRIESLVRSGAYPSAAAAIKAALAALEERQQAFDNWFAEEIQPAIDEMDEHPERALSADEVFENLRAHHEARSRKSA